MLPASLIPVLVVVLAAPLRGWRLPESEPSEHGSVAPRSGALSLEPSPAGEFSSSERLVSPSAPPQPAPRPDTRQHKRLVEIVPTKHRTKKGNALAYIVPKSSSVKKKLNKRKRIAGIVVQGGDEELGRSLESTEEILLDVTDSRSSESSAESSDEESDSAGSAESGAPGRGDSEPATSHGDAATPAAVSSEIDPEENINNILNDIVSYYKEHSDRELDTVIHDVLPHDEDPEYHVHYLIHKKRTNHNKNLENNTKSTPQLHAADYSNEDLHRALQHYFRSTSREYNDIDGHHQSQSRESDKHQSKALLLNKVNDLETHYDVRAQSHHNVDHHKHDNDVHGGHTAHRDSHAEDARLLTDDDDVLIHNIQDLIHKDMSVEEVLAQIESNMNQAAVAHDTAPLSDAHDAYSEAGVLHVAPPGPAVQEHVASSERVGEGPARHTPPHSAEGAASEAGAYIEDTPSDMHEYVYPVEAPYSLEDGLFIERVVMEDTSEQTAESASVEPEAGQGYSVDLASQGHSLEWVGQGHSLELASHGYSIEPAGQGYSHAAIPLNTENIPDIVFPDCFKLIKKKKSTKKADDSKSYTLMFLFNK